VADSTNQDYFSRPMGVLVDAIQGSQRNQGNMSSSSSSASNPTHPLGMNVLDSLTVHTKMSLIHNVVTQIMKMAQAKSSITLAPALIETYSRLLVYNEIESLGIKGFISHLLPTVFRQQAWGILHTLLEMFSYRLHHIQPHYRVQLLSHLHSLAAVPQTNQTQLHLCVESTALKLITGLGSAEVQPQLSRFQNEPKNLLSTESEELNKALVLTLARAVHVTAMSNENDIIAHFSQQGTPHLFLCLLWKMLLENDRISPLAYKQVAFVARLLTILDRIGARALSSHLRTFADFLVFEVSNTVGGQHVNKCIDALNDLIWKYHVISLDRLILCLALRSFEGNEIQVCFFIIHLLLIRPPEFKSRVLDFVKDNSPEHWKQTDWHEKHLAFHRYFEIINLQILKMVLLRHLSWQKYEAVRRPISLAFWFVILQNLIPQQPVVLFSNNTINPWRELHCPLFAFQKYQEKFYFEGLQDLSGQSQQHTYLPVYFGNICLRFLPVMDIVIHRFLELHPVATISVESLLEHLGCLYKFHGAGATLSFRKTSEGPRCEQNIASPSTTTPATPATLSQSKLGMSRTCLGSSSNKFDFFALSTPVKCSFIHLFQKGNKTCCYLLFCNFCLHIRFDIRSPFFVLFVFDSYSKNLIFAHPYSLLMFVVNVLIHAVSSEAIQHLTSGVQCYESCGNEIVALQKSFFPIGGLARKVLSKTRCSYLARNRRWIADIYLLQLCLTWQCFIVDLTTGCSCADRPLTYLYNTLHYYEQKLKDRPPLKKKLVAAITGAPLGYLDCPISCTVKPPTSLLQARYFVHFAKCGLRKYFAGMKFRSCERYAAYLLPCGDVYLRDLLYICNIVLGREFCESLVFTKNKFSFCDKIRKNIAEHISCKYVTQWLRIHSAPLPIAKCALKIFLNPANFQNIELTKICLIRMNVELYANFSKDCDLKNFNTISNNKISWETKCISCSNRIAEGHPFWQLGAERSLPGLPPALGRGHSVGAGTGLLHQPGRQNGRQYPLEGTVFRGSPWQNIVSGLLTNRMDREKPSVVKTSDHCRDFLSESSGWIHLTQSWIHLPTLYCTALRDGVRHYLPNVNASCCITCPLTLRLSAMAGKSPFPHTDWRFNEFPNPAAHALHVTCIELMALPVAAAVVGNNLLDVVLKGHTVLPRGSIENWMNAIGLILTALPEPYWAVLSDRILSALQGPNLQSGSGGQSIFQLLSFSSNHSSITEVQCCYLMALVHAVWYHASIGQISQIPQIMRERFKPVVKTEEQFLFLCHLVAPFFQRMSTERTRFIMDVSLE
ncbi:unnamed protein product, partial [Ixodes pacificus]